ncbi:helix-turn-helix domain-containing protein [Azospirillum sp.]|uniref:helix-turn-helix domain-containing protein n=1 Tax=Azospirillum sp. TaxID=34012 RepID=UPI003D72BEDC
MTQLTAIPLGSVSVHPMCPERIPEADVTPTRKLPPVVVYRASFPGKEDGEYTLIAGVAALYQAKTQRTTSVAAIIADTPLSNAELAVTMLSYVDFSDLNPVKMSVLIMILATHPNGGLLKLSHLSAILGCDTKDIVSRLTEVLRPYICRYAGIPENLVPLIEHGHLLRLANRLDPLILLMNALSGSAALPNAQRFNDKLYTGNNADGDTVFDVASAPPTVDQNNSDRSNRRSIPQRLSTESLSPLGRWLESCLIIKEWSNNQAAEALGISPRMLALIRTGKRRLTTQRLQKLIEVFGSPPQDTLTDGVTVSLQARESTLGPGTTHLASPPRSESQEAPSKGVIQKQKCAPGLHGNLVEQRPLKGCSGTPASPPEGIAPPSAEGGAHDPDPWKVWLPPLPARRQPSVSSDSAPTGSKPRKGRRSVKPSDSGSGSVQ